MNQFSLVVCSCLAMLATLSSSLKTKPVNTNRETLDTGAVRHSATKLQHNVFNRMGNLAVDRLDNRNALEKIRNSDTISKVQIKSQSYLEPVRVNDTISKQQLLNRSAVEGFEFADPYTKVQLTNQSFSEKITRDDNMSGNFQKNQSALGKFRYHDTVSKVQPKACPANTMAWNHTGTVADKCPQMFASTLQKATMKHQLTPHASGETCPAFYISLLGAKSVKQHDLRHHNVAAMQAVHPDVRVMGAVSWRYDWDAIRGMFKQLKIPVCFYSFGECGRKVPGIGKYGRWASLILAFAYQVRFQLPCMTLFEDDVELNATAYEQFRFGVHTFLEHRQKEALIVKCGQWGECFSSNLRGAKEFIKRLYLFGITSPSDEHIMHHLWDVTRTTTSMYAKLFKLLVLGNNGDIAATPETFASDFDYDASNNPHNLGLAVKAFEDSDKNATVIDLARVARSIADLDEDAPPMDEK